MTAAAGPVTGRQRTAVCLAVLVLLAACSAPAPATPSASWTGTTSAGTPVPVGSAINLPVPRPTHSWPTSPDRSTEGPLPLRPAGVVDPPPGQGVQRYLDQQPRWTACQQGFQCATVLAPLDWSQPDGLAITLAMKRRPATAGPELGVLFVNPGGPGGSAQDYVTTFPASGLERYTILGLDSRGSGASTPVRCGTAEQLDAWLALDGSPDTAEERQQLIDGSVAFAQQCRAASGVLLEHVSSIETVQDYELVRQLLGQPVLNMVGTSYGTFLAALYAEFYPQTTGRLVLDSPVNITTDTSISQLEGFELALHEFAAWCVSERCGLGLDEDGVINRIDHFLTDLDTRPISVGERTLTQTLATTGLAFYLYSGQQGYQNLARALQWAMQKGDGQWLLLGADLMNDRNSRGEFGTMVAAFPAIGCLDSADEGISAAFSEWQRLAEDAPVFGKASGPELTCPLWTVAPAPQIDFHGTGAPALLVLGATGDSATPYAYAQWMAQTLESAVLLTRQGAGHGSFDAGNSCIDGFVRDYLLTGVTPPTGTSCGS